MPPGAPNVEVHHADGTLGWPDAAPFDAILVSAAARTCPPALEAQLCVGGKLIAPLGGDDEQALTLVTRLDDTTWHRTALLGVRFVPLRTGF